MTNSIARSMALAALAALTAGAVWAQPVITTTSPLQAATVGALYTQTFAATEGGGPCTCTWSATGQPTWLSMTSAGVLSGTPPSTATTSSFMVTATDGASNSTSGSFTLPVSLVITTVSPLPAGAMGENYSQTLAAVGGSGSYTWAVSVGTLPANLTLNPVTGAITGQPSASTTSNFTIQVADTNSVVATKAFALTINPTLAITSTSPLLQGTVGVSYSDTLTLTGGVGPYTWAVTAGNLPGGLTLKPSTGVIVGQPNTAATANFTIQVTDSDQASVSVPFALTINPPLSITTTSPLPAGTVGVNYSDTLAATGGSGAYTWSVSVGTLPAGLTLAPGTGLISGMPTTAVVSASFTIQVTDTNSVTASKPFTLTINPGLSITTTSPLPAGAVGEAYSQMLVATGGSGTYTWSVSVGTLPAGLTLTPGTGLISGIPSTTVSSASFTIQVTDSNQVAATKPFTLTINPPLSITTTSLPNGAVTENYSQTLVAAGGVTPYTWAVSVGALPAGLTLNPATGAITGQPTATGAPNFTIQVTDANAVMVTKAFTLTVNATLTITSTSPLPVATVGVPYSQTLTETGGVGPYTWAVSTGSTLPAGLTLAPATGAISGMPTTASSASFTIQVTDADQATASMLFALTVDPALVISTTSPLGNGTVNGAYSTTLAGTGGMLPYTWSVFSGSLPGGLTLVPSTGVISGQPSATGTFSFVIQLKDSTAPTPNAVTKTFSITIAAFTITTAPTLPNATVGVPYSQTLAASGGAQPYAWAISKGTLPAALTLNSTSTTATITGTPAATATGPDTFTVTVTDTNNNTASQTFTLTVVIPPVINTTTLPNGTTGVAYSQALSASGGTTPYQWAIATGSLPAGLSLSPTTGTIAGNPSAAGASSFTIQLKDATGVTATSQPLTLTIVASVTITTPSPLPTGEVNIAYSQKLTATGGTSPYTWSVTGSGALPGGLSLSAGGTLSGTPSAAGTFNFTVQVTDSNRLTATAPLALTIAGTLGIATQALNGGSVNASYSQTLAPSGGVSPYTWTLKTGPLPAGLSLSQAGVISGTPTTTGTFPFTLTVTDALFATASRQFTVVIAVGLTVTTPPTLPTALVGVPYQYLLQASGGTSPYTWSNPAGSLPAGLSVTTNGNITGIPSAAGPFTFTVQVKDSAGNLASAQLSITVAPALSVTTGVLPVGMLGAAYSQSLAATGGTPPYTWSLLSGALPGGLTLSAGGAISGTAGAAGTFPFTVKVTDSAAFIATKQLSVTIAAVLSITSAAALPSASINVAYSQNVSASGGTPPYSWALSGGALPGGLTLSSGGAITGTPSATGTFQFTLTVTDSVSATASQQFTLIVSGGLTISTAALPGGKVGASYSQTLTAAGGVSPYTFSVSAGTLPPGITLNGAVLGGTPTKTGSYPFTIQVTDSTQATASAQFTIVIGGLAITTSAVPAAAVGTAYSYVLSASETAPYAWTITQGTLPDGLTLDKSSGTISGTPTAAGSSNVTVQVADSTKSTASATFTLTVISASFTGLSGTADSAQQVSGTLALGAAYPQDITGQVTLAFVPESSLASPADDPSIQFTTGGNTASFTIPANSTAPVSFAFQTGTVAGTITLTVSWQADGAALAVPAALTQAIQIAPAVPVITAVTATTTSSGFQVVITGYSNTREATQANLQFTPASGQTLQTTSLTVSLTTATSNWFPESVSYPYGGQFTLTLPFSVSDGTASAIGSISVQLVNTQGTSTASSATL